MSSTGGSNTKNAAGGWEGDSSRQPDGPGSGSGLGPSDEASEGSSLAMSLTSDEVNYLVFRYV